MIGAFLAILVALLGVIGILIVLCILSFQDWMVEFRNVGAFEIPSKTFLDRSTKFLWKQMPHQRRLRKYRW